MKTTIAKALLVSAAFALVATSCGDTTPEPVAEQTPSEITTPAPAADPAPAATPKPDEALPSATPAEIAAATATATEVAQPNPTPIPTPGPVAPNPSEYAFEPFAVSGPIESVDFFNEFGHPTGWGPPSIVTDGKFTHGEPSDGDYLDVGVAQVVFGDLDGDLINEAAVTTRAHTGGTGIFSSVGIYRIEDGLLQHVGPATGGDRANGGIYDIEIVDGRLIVEQFGTSSIACCPEWLTRSEYVIGERGPRLAQRFAPIAWLEVPGTDLDQELKFLPGTRSAAVTIIHGPSSPAVIFEARAEQVLEVRWVSWDIDESVVVTDIGTNSQVAPVAPDSLLFELPNDARYRVEFRPGPVSAVDTHTLHVIIHDAGGPTQLPTWSPLVEEAVRSLDPLVRTMVSRPVFTWLPTSNDPAAVNQLVADFVDAEFDPWLATAATDTHPDPDGSSEFEFRFDITLVGRDLVSIHFWNYEYVCCRPYPNINQRSLVLNLAAGRALDTGDIVDPNRLDELQRIWVATLDRDTEEGAFSQYLEPGRTYFSSLALAPTGLIFGTDRGTFGGAAQGPTTQLVTWTELGDLVDPGIVERARAASLAEPPAR